MRPIVRTALLAAAAIGGLCAADSASAQSYGSPYRYDRYAPPPPPPEGRYYPRDDRSYGQVDYSIPGGANSDGTVGPRPYVSQPDTTPDDPGRIAYDAEKDRRFDEDRYRSGYAYGAPPPRYGYARDEYAPPNYPGRYDRYARPYDDRRASPRYSDRYDEDAPSPRYGPPDRGYAPYPPAPRGW